MVVFRISHTIIVNGQSIYKLLSDFAVHIDELIDSGTVKNGRYEVIFRKQEEKEK